MGRKSLYNQMLHVLNEKMVLGESRKQAKNDLRVQLGQKYRFTMTTEGIHSIRTRDTYQAVAERFVLWCQNEQGVGKYAALCSCEELAPVYLQTRKYQGKSVWTLKTDRAALGKLFGRPVEFAIEARSAHKIIRSRGYKDMDRHFSEERNQDLVVIARATGGRREDLDKMCVQHFQRIGGHLFVEITGSKGGRNRISPVLPEMEKDVLNVLARAEAASKVKLFDRIHSKADIHSYRREYAQILYRLASQDRALRDELLQLYPPRREPKIKGSMYVVRRGTQRRVFNRDDVYLVSQALGHNRLEVTVTHYLL